MREYKYLIIGGGMTGDSAVKGIRRADHDGSICLISSDPHPPYNRPPLSKDLWKGKPEEKIWRKTDEYNAELILNTEVLNLDAQKKIVRDNKGGEYKFGKLLLATGGTPVKLPYGGENVIYFRTFDDYKRLRELTAGKNRFAVIGGGFIGSEIAAALAINGKQVVMIFPSEGICSKIFPSEIVNFINDYYKNKGVELMPNERVMDAKFSNGTAEITTQSGARVHADAVIAGLGIKPNTELASAAGIKTDNGIIVDEYLRTNLSDIYAAGDAANFYNPSLGERLRVEHEDNANRMGRHAGEVMGGYEKPYHHLPFFYSDMFDIGYEAVGEIDSRLETSADWQEKFKKGIIYYLKDKTVRGILLWGIFGKVNDARDLIGKPAKPR